jgi:hypothetical protein
MLDAVPDLRKTLKAASDEQLADIFGAFDMTITYDRPGSSSPSPRPSRPSCCPETNGDRSGERSRALEVAGDHIGPAM